MDSIVLRGTVCAFSSGLSIILRLWLTVATKTMENQPADGDTTVYQVLYLLVICLISLF